MKVLKNRRKHHGVTPWYQPDANTFVADVTGVGANTDIIGLGGGLSETDRTLTNSGTTPAATGAFKKLVKTGYYTVTDAHTQMLRSGGTSWCMAMQLETMITPTSNDGIFEWYRGGAPYDSVSVNHSPTIPATTFQLRDGIGSGWQNIDFSGGDDLPVGGIVTIISGGDGTTTFSGWGYGTPTKLSDLEAYGKYSYLLDYSSATFASKFLCTLSASTTNMANFRFYKYMLSKTSLVTIDV